MAESSSTLSVKALAKTFGDNVAVVGVSFDATADKVTALAGGNGSGKTTLMKMIAGVLTPDSGRVEWNGHKLSPGTSRKARLEGIEMVFQDCALCPDCSVLENLFLGREITSRLGFLATHNMKRLAQKMIERYGLPIPSLEAKPKQLSGGQQKAVAIGRALLSKPQLLLLDEPTAALGVREQETILRMLAELRSAGVGIIFCTHSPEEILSVADRVLILRRGELAHDLSMQGMSKPQLAVLMST